MPLLGKVMTKTSFSLGRMTRRSSISSKTIDHKSKSFNLDNKLSIFSKRLSPHGSSDKLISEPMRRVAVRKKCCCALGACALCVGDVML